MSATRSRSATIHGEGTRASLEPDLQDVTGQPHPTECRAEQVGIDGPRACDHVPCRDSHRQRINMLSDSPIAMMVFAVHVAGNHAANRDESRAGRYRSEITAWKEDSINLVERQACFGCKCCGRGVKFQNPIRQRRVRDRVQGTRQRSVAVSASGTASQRRTFRQEEEIFGVALLGRDNRKASPASDFHATSTQLRTSVWQSVPRRRSWQGPSA